MYADDHQVIPLQIDTALLNLFLTWQMAIEKTSAADRAQAGGV
jgi:hypothetical protein